MNRNFSNAIENWYKEYKRELPWRDSADPYVIWISEIILQQTRVVQGYDYFVRFMKRFPDVATLAEADEDEVMKYWQGLGYYSRARNLHAAAKSMNGVFPKTYPEVRALKGVGEYTAAAICSFAYNMPYAVVDGNVYRVLSRYLGIDTPIDSTEGKKLLRLWRMNCWIERTPHYTIRLLWTSERSNVLLKLPTACFVHWLTVVRRWQRGQWRSFRSSSTK
jgi:A/G-specific adenine glycosylase